MCDALHIVQSFDNTLEFSFPPPSTNLTLKVEPNLGEELHLDLSCVIDDELIVVESVPLHLGHLGVLGRAHGKGKVFCTARQLLHLVDL